MSLTMSMSTTFAFSYSFLPNHPMTQPSRESVRERDGKGVQSNKVLSLICLIRSCSSPPLAAMASLLPCVAPTMVWQSITTTTTITPHHCNHHHHHHHCHQTATKLNRQLFGQFSSRRLLTVMDTQLLPPPSVQRQQTQFPEESTHFY